MYYYWIAVVVFLVIAVFVGTNTWSPFQSQQVKEICANMTKAERTAAMKRGGLWGLLVGLIPGAMGLTLGPLVLGSALLGVMLCALLFPLAAFVLWKRWLPYCNRSQRSFFASTEWAKSQGIRADDIRLFNWQE
jgi:ABC-type phosphate transport system permease subunit